LLLFGKKEGEMRGQVVKGEEEAKSPRTYLASKPLLTHSPSGSLSHVYKTPPLIHSFKPRTGVPEHKVKIDEISVRYYIPPNLHYRYITPNLNLNIKTLQQNMLSSSGIVISNHLL
jgi:hypothetical protein